MNHAARAKSLVFLGLTLFATGLIASGLPGLQLLPGMPLPDWEGGSPAVPLESAPLPHLSVNILAIAILGILLGSTLLYMVYHFLKGTAWKQMLSSLRFSAVLFLVISAVVFLLLAVGRVHITPADTAMELPPVALPLKGLPLGSLPSWLVWLAWIGLGLGMVLLLVRIFLWQSRRNRKGDPLSLQAELALRALESGESFKNVIVRCYTEMSLILQREQGLALEETMTAQEFERLLIARGIPHPPIDQLTCLFEAARYGYHPPTSADERAAYESLNAIVRYIRQQGSVR